MIASHAFSKSLCLTVLPFPTLEHRNNDITQLGGSITFIRCWKRTRSYKEKRFRMRLGHIPRETPSHENPAHNSKLSSHALGSWDMSSARWRSCSEQCIFLLLPSRQAGTDKERPLVMLEGVCLSSPTILSAWQETSGQPAPSSAGFSWFFSGLRQNWENDHHIYSPIRYWKHKSIILAELGSRVRTKIPQWA